MIVDAHTHVGDDPYAGQQKGPESASAADRYVAVMQAAGVDRGFAFTSWGLRGDTELSNDNMARARDQHPEVILPWGVVDPRWPESRIRQEMRRCVEELGFHGFKFHPWVQGFSLMAAGMDIVAEECIAMDVPVTFHDGSPPYCTALQGVYYARAHPGLRVLSAHAGLREGWRDIVEPAKELDNYWICLSGPTQQGIQTLYDQLGPDKLLFGSDGGSMHPAVVSNCLRRIRALRAPQEDIDKILGLNALQFLGLES